MNPTPTREHPVPNPWPLVAICVGYFMVILDAVAVNVALPAISAGLGGSRVDLEWVVDSYGVFLGSLLLSGGSLGDRRGAKGVFMAGVVLFTLASLACGLAPSMGVLIGARCAQGLGAALAVPTSLALLQAAYADQVSRRRALGVWGGVAGVAAAAGPVLGGVLVSAFGWRAVFFINLPVGGAGLWLAAHFLPTPPPRPRRLDLAGQASGVCALGALAYALIEAGQEGWASARVEAAFATFVLATFAFVLAEWRAEEPMLPLALFSSAAFSGANVVGLLINLAFYGELFEMSLYLQQSRGLTPFQAGLALLPQLAMATVGSTLSGLVMARRGPRLPMILGLVVGAVGMVGLGVTGPHGPYWMLVGPLMAVGTGMSVVMPAATAAVLEAVPARHKGVASGAFNAARQSGGVIGVALVGTLAVSGSDFWTPWRSDMAVGVLAFGVAAIVAVLSLPPRCPPPGAGCWPVGFLGCLVPPGAGGPDPKPEVGSGMVGHGISCDQGSWGDARLALAGRDHAAFAQDPDTGGAAALPAAFVVYPNQG